MISEAFSPKETVSLGRILDEIIEKFNIPTNPAEAITWVTTPVVLKHWETGEIIFERDCKFPDFYSEKAKQIVASKYFKEIKGKKETSLTQLVSRVVKQISEWAQKDELLTAVESKIFNRCLSYLLYHQYFAFNSPVWFNGGRVENPQMSACFINGVEDSMESILDLIKTEGMLFKGGSGTGTNYSTIRGSMEKVAGGGIASGPLSFIKALDASAGAIKSGGVCLAPDQLVWTNEGPKTVQALAESEEKFICLSFDPPANRYKMKWATAWKSGHKEVFEVVTDKGSFRMSGDHPVRMADNSVRRVYELERGKALYSCNVRWKSGSISVRDRFGKGDSYTRISRMIAQDILGEDIKGKVVHHRDGNHENASLSNLEVTIQAAHASYHTRELMKDNSNYLFGGLNSSGIREDLRGQKNGMARSSKFWKNEDKVKAYSKKQSELISPERARKQQKSANISKMLNYLASVVNADLPHTTLEEYYDSRLKLGYTAPWGFKFFKSSIEYWFGSMENMNKTLAESNHRVISVNSIGFMDVYDVEVECPTLDDKSSNSGHNFVIWSSKNITGSGIAVFNTRRAARMNILNDNHPDIEEFIVCKTKENKKAVALVKEGFSDGLDGEAHSTVAFQNGNNSVRCTNNFMLEVTNDMFHDLIGVTDKKVIRSVKAKDLFKSLAKSTWECGDPGVQFDDTIQSWNTVANSGRFDASNPCSEFIFINNSSCNLASINLMKFFQPATRTFDYKSFELVCSLVTMAQETIVGNASYPTEKITENSQNFRPLGLGYTSWGDLAMSLGLSYDSTEARALNAGITSLMTATGYNTSALMASIKGPFAAYELNKQPMRNVLLKHRYYAVALGGSETPFLPLSELPSFNHFCGITWLSDIKAPLSKHILEVARYSAKSWGLALENGKNYGFRNSQISCLAPTGTISFFMDSNSTGIEPQLGLVVEKSLVGGGKLILTCECVKNALRSLGYEGKTLTDIDSYITTNGTALGAPNLSPEEIKVFLTSLKSEKSKESLSWKAHVDMMASAQPFLSGAISKTCNMDESATVEDIEQAYLYAWEAGVKCLAIYRDNSKSVQVLKTDTSTVENLEVKKRKMGSERAGEIHKFEIGNLTGFLIMGLFDDGTLGEIFIKLTQQGSALSGLMDAVAISTSLALQSGCSIDLLCHKHMHTRYEPNGWTKHKNIPIAKSLTDYVFRYLALRFGAEDTKNMAGLVIREEDAVKTKVYGDRGTCDRCGGTTIRCGTCHTCENCGNTTGCS